MHSAKPQLLAIYYSCNMLQPILATLLLVLLLLQLRLDHVRVSYAFMCFHIPASTRQSKAFFLSASRCKRCNKDFALSSCAGPKWIPHGLWGNTMGLQMLAFFNQDSIPRPPFLSKRPPPVHLGLSVSTKVWIVQQPWKTDMYYVSTTTAMSKVQRPKGDVWINIQQ